MRTIIRNYHQHKHTHTPTHSHIPLQSAVKIPTESKRFFFRYFSIFDSFHFLNCLMIAVLQKKKKKKSIKPSGHSLYFMN